MADPPRFGETSDEKGRRYGRESTIGIPRWVKVVGLVLAVVALLVVVMILVGGGGGHTPLRHGGATDNSPPVSVIGGGHTLSAGVHG